MECLRIVGGRPLNGNVSIHGSKNAALPILAASILADSPVRLSAVPQLLDVDRQRQVLEELGVASTQLSDGDLLLETVDHSPIRARYELVSRMRASFCVLGPLLARRGSAEVSLPGGCNLGPRPVDLHLRALEALGAEIQISGGFVIASARRLRGAQCDMLGPHGPSVTGTANALCAATLAKGVTTISNAAIEPEVEDLGHFLQAMGAEIEGIGTRTIVVSGREGLAGTTHRVIPDRVEAGTFLLTVAATGGSVCVENVLPAQLDAVLGALNTIGASCDVQGNRIRITMNGRPRAAKINCLPFPGMPSDLQPLWMALLSRSTGKSEVRDYVFPHRFLHVTELGRFGVRVRQAGSAADIEGIESLSGATVQATDLRAGAALVLAGLVAHGETNVYGLHHLDRGYENLDGKLRHLGARIVRCQTKRGTLPSAAAVDSLPEWILL